MEAEAEDVVGYVETVLFGFVVGKEVLACAVCVVAAAIFVLVGEDGRCHRGG